MSSNKLSRELLRWIQSLDLAYSVKNVKRDFSNGFLVAEIVSRYFDKEISMHSYDNGNSTSAKKDNWKQLLKFFTKIPGLEDVITLEQVDQIVCAENGAAVVFLTQLYQRLTRREVQEVHPTPVEEAIPPYAKTTGSALIHEKMKGATVTNSKDQSEIVRKMKQVNDHHEEELQLDRIADPERFASSPARSSPKVVRGSTKTMGEHSSSSPKSVTVKEVQVRSLNEENLAALRASRANAGANSTVVPDNAATRNATISMKKQERKHLETILNEYVQRRWNGENGQEILEQFDPNLSKFQSIIALSKDEQVIPRGALRDVLDGLHGENGILADSCLEYPKDFWVYCTNLLALLEKHSNGTNIVEIVLEVLATFGAECLKRNESHTIALFTDYALPKVIAMLNKSDTTRRQALRILYSFYPDNIQSHLQAIKELRKNVPDIPTFIHVLAILVYMEPELDETLLDLYHYYATIGLDNTSEKLRAAAISMLPAFLPYQASLVHAMLPRLVAFSYPYAWWEVKVQLIILSSSILNAVDLSEEDAGEKEAIIVSLDILHKEFTPKASLNIRKLGLSRIGVNLAAFQELVPLYVDVLFSMPTSMYPTLLSTEDDENSGDSSVQEQLPLSGASGNRYNLAPLSSVWDSVGIARQIYYDRLTEDNYSPDEKCLLVVKACFQQLSKNQRDRLVDIYEDIKGALFDGLSSEELCSICADILSLIAFYSTMDLNLITQPQLLSVCEQINTLDRDEKQPKVLSNMLREIAATSSTYNASVRELLQIIQDKNEDAFESTALCDLLMEIMQN